MTNMKKILQLKGLAWSVAGTCVILVLLYEIYRPTLSAGWQNASQVFFGVVGVAIVSAVGLFLSRYQALQKQLIELTARIAEKDSLVEKDAQRLDAIFRIGQKFVEATDEQEILELVLKISVELVGAKGASFVPLDEHGQPLTALSHGNLSLPISEAWMEYLASPKVRERCQTCEQHGTLHADQTCPVLSGPFSDAMGLFCLPVRRGDREFGVLNLFMAQADTFDASTEAFLRAMIDETALALEGVSLRRREIEGLRQMQALRQKSDVQSLLTVLLENVHQTMEADFSLLMVPERGDCKNWNSLSIGEIPLQVRPFINGVIQSVIESGEPLLLGDVAGDPNSPPDVRSLLAAPLQPPDGQTVGAILVGNRRARTFNQRQLVVLQTVSAQVGLVVQNSTLLAEIEYKAVVQERTRLAREIHDGLAQTLGFLKLQVAQMQNYLKRNDLERLRKNVDLCYNTLSEAYQDARQAIDGLRIWPADSGIAGWLDQTVMEFQEMSGLTVEVRAGNVRSELPSEIHAQLIRIVQEALSNIRKHAAASAVVVSYKEDDKDLWFEIQDDGIGFSPEDVPGPSRHGFRGMRERAELIGADFQVISRPKEGTTIRLRLPLVRMGSMNGSKTGEVVS